MIFTMSKNELKQMLSDNGFSYCEHDNETTLIIENIEICKMEQRITYVDVKIYDNLNQRIYFIYINFENNRDKDTSNMYIDLSMYINDHNDDEFLTYELDDKDEFIGELQRLNSIGQNIKG